MVPKTDPYNTSIRIFYKKKKNMSTIAVGAC